MSLSVLFVHNRYTQRGGEDTVFEAESALLESRGHRVARLIFDNTSLLGPRTAIESARLAAETVWSRPAQRRRQAEIDAFRPDVVHFHNTLPRVSPAAYRTAKRAGAAVVQTLHNFRLVCPSGLMYRDGKPCHSCLRQAVPLAGAIHGCYRDSRVQSATVAAMLTLHRALGTWRSDVDLYLSPSQFLKGMVVTGGLPGEKVLVKPNFLYPDPGLGGHEGGYVLFAGRLTATKGIETILSAYERHPDGLPPLRIAGDGDLAARVEAAALRDTRLTYLGPRPRDEVLRLMGEARALVFPSTWYENFPMSITEAFGRGLSVIASRIGALPELVEDGVNGLLFDPADPDDLAAKLRQAASDNDGFAAMGDAARRAYVSRYSAGRAYELLISAYQSALAVPAPKLKQTSEAHVL